MHQRLRNAGYKPSQATAQVVVIAVEVLVWSHPVCLGSSYSNEVYHLEGPQCT